MQRPKTGSPLSRWTKSSKMSFDNFSIRSSNKKKKLFQYIYIILSSISQLDQVFAITLTSTWDTRNLLMINLFCFLWLISYLITFVSETLLIELNLMTKLPVFQLSRFISNFLKYMFPKQVLRSTILSSTILSFFFDNWRMGRF